MIVIACDPPLEDLSPAIRPEAESQQDHPRFPPALSALPLLFLWRDRLLQRVDRYPHAITLETRGDIDEGGRVRSFGDGIALSDALCECEPSHMSLNRGTPSFLHLPHALSTTNPDHHLVIQTHLPSRMRFQHGTVARRVMLTDVACLHRHTSITDRSPPVARSLQE
jgi:hypothetical protein